MKKVAAIVLADIHLSLRPPPARVGEPNWFEAMRRPLSEVRRLASEHSCPVLCAGDIFDHWKAPPELINFALDALPEMIAIPGQHDMPEHSLAEMQRSAFNTLMQAGKITPLMGNQIFAGNEQIDIYGFPWGFPVERPVHAGADKIKVALVHEYVWAYGACYQGADMSAHYAPRKYKGYDAVVIGDNHKPWESNDKGLAAFNCGGFMRRRSDDTHRPRVGLLLENGSIVPHYLDTSADVFRPVETGGECANSEGLEEFLMSLRSLESTSLDFREELRRVMDRDSTSPAVRTLLMQAMEK